jgi:hypothetical protein
MIRRASVAAIAAGLAALAVAFPRIVDLSNARMYEPATHSESILGAWESQITCGAFVRAFEDAGIGDLAARWLVNSGLQPGPIHALASRSSLCRDASRLQRMHVFLADGTLRTYQGRRLVDDCRCYRAVNSHTFIVLGRRGETLASLEYRIDGDALTFEGLTPKSCSTVRCRGHLAWAVANYSVNTWRRVT